MGRIGMSELLIIFLIFVVFFGYKKLPDLGKSLGRGIKNFKRSIDEPDEIDVTPQATQEKEKEKEKSV